MGETFSSHLSRPQIHYILAHELPEGESLPLAAQKTQLVDRGNRRYLRLACLSLNVVLV